MSGDDTSSDKVLVTGGSGLLGSALCSVLRNDHTVHATYHNQPERLDRVRFVSLDLKDEDAILALAHKIEPDAVFHCAALTDVDYCETNPGEAKQVNEIATGVLADAAADLKADFAFISTDAVYGGDGAFHSENDPLNPLNTYTETKVTAEDAVRERLCGPLVIRTAIHGISPGPKTSLSEWIHGALSNGKEIRLFDDAFFSPIYANDLARILARAMEAGLSGTYNVGAPERVNKLEFGLTLADVFELPADAITPSKQSEFGFIAERPRDNSLSVEKITKALGRELPTVRDGILRMREDFPNDRFELGTTQ